LELDLDDGGDDLLAGLHWERLDSGARGYALKAGSIDELLSAVEGLKLATPAFEHYVVPLTIVILAGLFAVQTRGTARVASFFGPVMVVWFVAIAIAGLHTPASAPTSP
jgi:hypothetical protein